jgi:hypothetical protein
MTVCHGSEFIVTVSEIIVSAPQIGPNTCDEGNDRD